MSRPCRHITKLRKLSHVTSISSRYLGRTLMDTAAGYSVGIDHEYVENLPGARHCQNLVTSEHRCHEPQCSLCTGSTPRKVLMVSGVLFSDTICATNRATKFQSFKPRVLCSDVGAFGPCRRAYPPPREAFSRGESLRACPDR